MGGEERTNKKPITKKMAPKSQNRCPLSSNCVLLNCKKDHPSARCSPCKWEHEKPEHRFRCSYLHEEDNDESYLRIHARWESAQGGLKEVLFSAFLAMSQSIRDVGHLRRTLRGIENNRSAECKKCLHDIRETIWAREQFCDRMLALLVKYDNSPSTSGAVISAMRREIQYYQPKDKPDDYWLVYSERGELLSSIAPHPVTILSAEEASGKTSQVPLYLLDDDNIGPVYCSQSSSDSVESDAQRVTEQYQKSILKGNEKVVDCLVETKKVSDINAGLVFGTDAVLLSFLSSKRFLKKYSMLVIDDALPLTEKRKMLYQKLGETIQTYPHLRVLLMTDAKDVSPLQSLFLDYCPVAPVVIVPQE